MIIIIYCHSFFIYLYKFIKVPNYYERNYLEEWYKTADEWKFRLQVKRGEDNTTNK